MQDLGGGVWRSLSYLAGAVVAGFGGEVNAAVNSSIRKHGSSFISLPWHWWQHICGMKQINDAREAWKYQGLSWEINVSLCTFAFQLRQVHKPTKGRWCTTIAKLSAAVTGLPLVLHVSLPKTIFFFFFSPSYLQLWKWSLEYFSTEECFQLLSLCQNQCNCLGFRKMMKGENLQIAEGTCPANM